MKKYFILPAIAALMVFITLRAVNVISPFKVEEGTEVITDEPDFAFPDKVARESLQRLDSALATGNSPVIVRSLMDYSLARTAISPDYIPEAIARIDSVAAKSDSCTASLLYLFQAKIYSNLYDSQRWKFDNREAPAEPLPANPQEWTGEQFCNVISSLLDRATQPAQSLQKAPLSDWEEVVSGSRIDYIFYPTLLDFVYTNAIKIYNTLSPHVIEPYRDISLEKLIETQPGNPRLTPFISKAVELDHRFIAMNANRPAPRMIAMINLIKILNPVKSANLFLQLYEKNAMSEYGAEALLEVACKNLEQKKLLAEYLQQAIDRFPDYIRVENLKYCLNKLMTAQAHLNINQCFAPGVPADVELRGENLEKVRILIYKEGAYKTPVVDKTFDIGTILPNEVDTTISLTLNEPGYYRSILVVDDQSIMNRIKNLKYADRLVCTNQLPLIIGMDNQVFPYIVNSTTGAPLNNVKVISSYRKNKFTFKKDLGFTDHNGTITTPFNENNDNNNFTFTFINNGDSISTDWYYYNYYQRSSGYTAGLYTDLPLYHHGDTVRWVAVVYENSYLKGVVADKRVYIAVEDASGNNIYNGSHTTDASGRVSGYTVLPADGLSGYYQLRIGGSRFNFIKSIGFQVNDYKLPSFTVRANVTARSNDPDKAVSIECNASTYSGFPLGGASVSATLTRYNNYYYEDETVWTRDTVTGHDGSLLLSIPSDILKSDNANTRFKMVFKVTSASGETEFASTYFTTGKPYFISSPSGNRVICTNKSFSYIPKVEDAAGNNVNIPLTVKISTLNDKVILESKIEDIKLKSIKPGRYTVTFAPVNSALATPCVIKDVIFYNETGECPVDKAVWIPQTENRDIEVEGVTSYDITYGSSIDNVNILVIESVDSLITAKRWITPGNGMHKYKVNIPDGSHKITVSMYAVNKCHYTSSSQTIKNLDSYPEIKIASETFRDKVVPGEKETISLEITDKNGTPVPANVLLTLNSEAINQLAPSYDRGISTPSLHYNAPLSQEYYVSAYLQDTYSKPFLSERKFYSEPEFNLYGMSYWGTRSNIRRSRGMNSSPDFKSADGVATGLAYESKMSNMSVVEQPCYEIKNQEESFESEVDDSMEEGQNLSTDDFTYRPSELPLAFFAPMLSTDSSGRLTYTYTVPDANTTWRLATVVYTDRLLTAQKTAKIVASRPVMVQSNLPRFLRYGDSIDLKSMVMNNTDSTITATTTVTLLDPATNRLIGSKDYVNRLRAGESAIISYNYTTPDCGEAIIYRVKSTTGQHSDGEQDFIPLMPATQPVITSMPFFIPASCNDSTIILPPVGNKGTSTLYVYDNPVWEVLTALPSIAEQSPTTSTDAASALYSAAVARGLMNNHPSIKKALADWLLSDRADSTLISMFERNNNLKQLSLNATPWVRDAMTDKERLDHLALMLDDSNTRSLIKDAIKALDNLAQSDGGLSWSPGCNYSSPWATQRFLTLMASLKLHGYIPENKSLSRIMDNAMTYCDSIACTDFLRYSSNGDYRQFVLLRSILGYKATDPTITKIINTTVQNILKSWKKDNLMDKATDALILYYNGYPSKAKELIASIMAYSISSPEKGIWWQATDSGDAAALLTTFETVNTGNQKVIDGVAQWLILAKTNQSWGNGSSTAAAVDALIGAIPAEKAVSAKTEVTINNRPVENNAFNFPGMTVMRLDNAETENSLHINKPTGLPAFGSLINRSVTPIKDIKAHNHPSVSITKRLNVTAGDRVIAADTLKTGDRVNVQLVVTVKDRLDYVTIIDRNGACLEPVDQLSSYRASDGLWYYREVTDTETRLYIDHLLPGTYIINYSTTVMAAGCFSSGVATLQSQLNPGVDANSAAQQIVVNE